MTEINVRGDVARYLLPTEKPVVDVRRHWASLGRSAVIFLGLLLLGLIMVGVLGSAQFFAVLGVVELLGSFFWVAWVVADWRAEHFLITDKRVLLINGLITRRVAIMPLNRVTDLTYERSVIGRILGYGVFVMESAGQHQALSRIDYLPTPDKLYHDVSTLLFGPRSTVTYGRREGPVTGPASGPTTMPLPRL
ncbi:MAG TPA: PH domain-containing protein [Jatrophihabitans sp.]